MPQKINAAFALAYKRAISRSCRRCDAAERPHFLGRAGLGLAAQRVEVGREAINEGAVVKFFVDDDVNERVEKRDVGAGAEAEHVRGMAAQGLAARVHDDQRRAALHGVFDEGRGDRMIDRRVRADDHDHIGMRGLRERRTDGAGADALHQRGDRGGMT